MPLIFVEGPPIREIEKKRKFVEKLTSAMADTYDIPREHMVVLIRENQPQNVAVGGKLIIDKNTRE